MIIKNIDNYCHANSYIVVEAFKIAYLGILVANINLTMFHLEIVQIPKESKEK
jgi:hypothetical protein